MRRFPLLASLVLALLVAGSSAPVRGAVDVPTRLTDQEFWRLTQELSEPNGMFRSENLISNEMVLARVMPQVAAKAKPGGVYLGVGPEQNFSYLAVIKPRLAFITDIRRGNLHVMLMYKALFETSADRAEFIAKLFVKPKLSGVGATSSAREIMDAVWAANTLDEAAFISNLNAMQRHLTKTRALPLDQEDMDGLARTYRAFFWYGPAINYSAGTTLAALAGGRSATYWDLMTQVDADGRGLSYMGSEEKWRFIKDMFSRNAIVPLVGNFSGPKTIRAVGAWVRERGGIVNTFYVSSVENYLRRDGSMPTYCASVATLPMDDSSFFIRAVSGGAPAGLSLADLQAIPVTQSANGSTFTVITPGTGQYTNAAVIPLSACGQ